MDKKTSLINFGNITLHTKRSRSIINNLQKVNTLLAQDTNKKNIIISLGCSMTEEGYFLHHDHAGDMPDHFRGGWKMWPEVFKDLLEERDNHKYELVNLGQSGCGMDYCFDNLIEIWPKLKKRIKFVLWGGTEFSRFDHLVEDYGMVPSSRADINYVNLSSRPGDTNNRIIKTSEQFKKYGSLEYVDYVNQSWGYKTKCIKRMNDIFRKITFTEDLCKLNNSEFLYYPLLQMFVGKSYYITGGTIEPGIKKQIEWLNELTYINDISKNKERHKHYVDFKSGILGVTWNTWHNDLQLRRTSTIPLITRQRTEWPNTDGHPTEHGQVDIANKIWSWYVKYN